MPPDWERCEIEKPLCGTVYHICYERGGENKIFVGGELFAGDILPQNAGGRAEVKVIVK